MMKVIIERDYDDHGRIIHEIVTQDGVVTQELTLTYPAELSTSPADIQRLKVVPNE